MKGNRLFGYCRDKLIAENIEKFRCLDAEQIEIMFIRETCNKDCSQRQTQNIIKRLAEKKELIKRERLYLDEPYKCYIKDFEQKEHIVFTNWMLIHYLIKHPFEKIYFLQYQRDYKIKIPDLFLVTYNPFIKQNSYKALFFEMDKSISNKFDAIEKYNLLKESQPYDEYVHLTAPHFPKILISTTDNQRLKEINNLILKQNKNNLRFETSLIWNLKEECKSEKITNFRSKFINDSNPMSVSLC